MEALQRMDGIEQVLRRTTEILRSPAMEALQRMDGIEQALRRTTEILRSPAMEALQRMDGIEQVLRRTTKMLNSPTMEAFLKMDRISQSWFENFDVNPNGEIIYDDVVYDNNAIIKEIEWEVQSIAKAKNPLTFKELSRKYWAIMMLLLFLWTVPNQFEEASKTNQEIWLEHIAPALFNAQFVVYVKSGSGALIREEANTKAEIVCTVPYSEGLIVLDKIKYWYEVEYANENGEVFRGWIANVNVEAVEGK